MPEIIVIAHNIRSSHNIGSIFRTCEGLGIKKLILSGYSPYPAEINDKRLPHVRIKADKTINKTALGAEKHLDWEYSKDVLLTISNLRARGYLIASLEQKDVSINLDTFTPPDKIAVILGSEVEGVDESLVNISDVIIEINMKGKKESFNVSVAAAICLYKLSTA
jgi:tRNA G18 (ribose-2'-O)-methylase SpoU